MRIIEERTKVKDSDNQLNNSALSGAEFATFYAKLRQKRVKSPENRKKRKKEQKEQKPEKCRNRKSAKRAKSGQLPAQVALAGAAGAHAALASARPSDTVGHRAHYIRVAPMRQGRHVHVRRWHHAVAAHDGCHAP